MVGAYYAGAFGLSVLLMLVYVLVYHRHYDVHISMIFVLVPINNLAQLLLSESESLEAVLLANKVMYIGGCYTILMVTLAVFSLCDIALCRWVRFLMYAVTTAVFFFALQIDRNELYYKSVTLERQSGVSVPIKEYGPLHKYFYIMVVIYFLLGVGAIFYSYFKQHQVSRQSILLLALPEVLSFFSFFGGRALSGVFPVMKNVELIPFAYDTALIVYLVISHRILLYDVPDTVIDSLIQKGETGFVSFDKKLRYLGSNETAKSIFPELSDMTVDSPLTEGAMLGWLRDFEEDNSRSKVFHKVGEETYLIEISILSDGDHERGYQLYITDDTKNQQYIALLDSFNTELKAEVAEKTAHIVEMHDNLIMSMAVMVESRDNSTGGHIRRTSEGVRILIDEIRKDDKFHLTDEFCRDLIKAAPMHDLGKIAVDDDILRKPGRFTDEEFEIMKTHAAKGASIVHEILKGTDDWLFQLIAENVAHYHHERMDGSGYPEGLLGDQIPLEARIMAIADVYDALVSKRVYKESMSFEEADRIIMESMGKHFDKKLEPYYVAARPRLESYYSSLEEN